MIGNPFFRNPYGLDLGGGKNVGGRPKKVKPSFAPISTAEDGLIMPKVTPDVMNTANEYAKKHQMPPGLTPKRSRASQNITNDHIADAMAKSKNVRNSR